ncbi:unnamed protein product [Camellia sinensis]
MASSSTNNSNIRLKLRLCDCGRTAMMYIVRMNENGNQGRLFFVCPLKYVSIYYTIRYFTMDIVIYVI